MYVSSYLAIFLFVFCIYLSATLRSLVLVAAIIRLLLRLRLLSLRIDATYIIYVSTYLSIYVFTLVLCYVYLRAALGSLVLITPIILLHLRMWLHSFRIHVILVPKYYCIRTTLFPR